MVGSGGHVHPQFEIKLKVPSGVSEPRGGGAMEHCSHTRPLDQYKSQLASSANLDCLYSIFLSC